MKIRQKKSFSKVLALLLIMVSLLPLQAETTTERRTLFNYDWKFTLANQQGAEKAGIDDSGWRKLQLPHDWSIEGTIQLNNSSGNDGGYFPTGIGWYRKSFFVPQEWEGKKISVLFEGVYMNAEVFINGTSLGNHPYGYSSFIHDLTPYLKINEHNIIAVKVDNSHQKNCRWYSGSGIYRHVWLYVTEPVHIAHWGVGITTPFVHPEKATVVVKTKLRNDTPRSKTLQVSVKLKDSAAQNVGSSKLSVQLAAGDEKEVVQSIEVSGPSLWSIDSPNLYTASVSLIHKGKELDQTNNSFGIRSIHFSTERGFQLNGQTIQLNGGCVHHDHGSLGAASYDLAEERKVKLLKKAGFNAVRTSHNPFSPAFYDACDRLGLLVIDEVFDGWRSPKTPHDYANYFDKWWKKDLEAMVLRDRNHPSIIMWSIGNEIIERTEPEAILTAQQLAAYVRSLDATRPVTSALTSWNQGWEIFDALFAAHDVGGYNYNIHHAEADHQRVPSRIMVQTESYPKDAFYCWNMVNKHPYIIGDFVWTALDYLGESGIGGYYYPGEEAVDHWVNNRYPWHGAYCGDIDLTGWRKPISHYRSMLWNQPSDFIYIAVREPSPQSGPIQLTSWAVWPTWERWNWKGNEGKAIEVEVYSTCERVRLFLNEQLIGEQSTSLENEYKALFTLPYSPGILRAVGVNGTEETCFSQLETEGEAEKIRISADRDELTADGLDLLYLTVEATDNPGRIVTDAGHRIQVTVDGPATIAGIDNGNLKDTDPYTADNRRLNNGRAVVILKSTRNKGKVYVTIGGAGLRDARIELNSH